MRSFQETFICLSFHTLLSFYSPKEWTSVCTIDNYSPQDLLKADVYSFCATMSWLCVPELRLSRLVDPIQQRTIIGVGEAAHRHVNPVELTADDLSWLDEFSPESEQEVTEREDQDDRNEERQNETDEEDNQWGVLKKDWQSVIRGGLCERPQDRPSLLELYSKLVSMKYKLNKR